MHTAETNLNLKEDRLKSQGRGSFFLKDLWNSPHVPLTEEEEHKAREVLARQKRCGSFPIVVEKECGGKLGTWYKCGSPLCFSCARLEAKRKIAPYIEALKELLKEKKNDSSRQLTFVTLTIKSHTDVRIAVEVLYEALSRLRDYWLGPRKLKELRERYEEEVERYLDNCGIKGELRELLRRDWVERWEEFELRVLERGSFKLKNLGMWLWHFEITFNPTVGWHPHFHGITDVKIPKLLLTVIWREVTEGLGEVTDIRYVKGEKGIIELGKYEVKPHIDLKSVEFIPKDQNGENEEEDPSPWDFLIDELKLELLIALRGRRKWIAWNFHVEKKKECPCCGKEGCKVARVYKGRWLQDDYRLTYRDLRRLEAGELELGVEWTIRERDRWSGEEWVEKHTGLLYYDTLKRTFLIKHQEDKDTEIDIDF